VAARTPKLCYWQDAPVPRSQLVLFATTLDERIPEDHPVRLLDFMWLVSGRSLDHTTISEFRRKHGKELKNIYKQMISLAVSMGVVKLSELCIDGTKVQANAGRFKTFKRENIAKLIDALDAEISEALATMESDDSTTERLSSHSSRPTLAFGVSYFAVWRAFKWNGGGLVWRIT
jgi:hypothetical protein